MTREVHGAQTPLIPAVFDAVLARGERACGPAQERTEVPVLERLVEAPAHEALPVRRERDAVHTVAMPFEPLHQYARRDVPDPHDRVERARGDEPPVR